VRFVLSRSVLYPLHGDHGQNREDCQSRPEDGQDEASDGQPATGGATPLDAPEREWVECQPRWPQQDPADEAHDRQGFRWLRLDLGLRLRLLRALSPLELRHMYFPVGCSCPLLAVRGPQRDLDGDGFAGVRQANVQRWRQTWSAPRDDTRRCTRIGPSGSGIT
jgi:hypothetical protein